MLDKIILGTANFSMPYGILNNDVNLDLEQISSIINLAVRSKINTFDTAYAYGTSLEILKNIFKKFTIKNPKIINKFSVLQDFKKLLINIKKYCEEAEITQFASILIHDPNNITQIDIKELQLFIDNLLSSGLVKNIGVSVYDLEEARSACNYLPITVVQCPINPLNQAFLQTQCQDFFQQNNIEVHGRSLFLQGILLANKLPKQLKQLSCYWKKYWLLVKKSNMRPLEAILQWATNQHEVDKWVIGVASVDDLQEIINVLEHHKYNKLQSSLFNSLVNINSPYIDPRNWS